MYLYLKIDYSTLTNTDVMQAMTFSRNLAGTLRDIYRPRYMLFNVAAAVAYYLAIAYLNAIQNSGVSLFLGIPVIEVYALAITSSVMLTVSIYSIRNTIRNSVKVSGSTLSVATAAVGGLFCGCGCAASFLFTGLVGIGFGAASVFAVTDTISIYKVDFIALLIGINLFATIYYLNRLSKPSCRIRKGKKR
jgi:predicted Co/Zn/Cd cation transporter (cation efflux family)